MTTAHRTPTDAERRYFQCPDWCIRWDHGADALDYNEAPVHYGPKYGPVCVQGRGSTFEAIVYAGDEGGFVDDPDELRRAAEGALKAAEWIETHR